MYFFLRGLVYLSYYYTTNITICRYYYFGAFIFKIISFQMTSVYLGRVFHKFHSRKTSLIK